MHTKRPLGQPSQANQLSPLALGLITAGFPTTSASTAAKPQAPQEDRPARRRAKLWELTDKHHCPIVGTCLSRDDLAHLARRFGFGAARNDEYGMHVEAVGHCRHRNPVSEAIQRLLDARYQATLTRYARLESADALADAWKASLAAGEVASALWATYTHRAATTDTRRLVYGDIHMLSHQVGAGQAADLRRLQHLESAQGQLQQTLDSSRAEMVRLLSENQQLQQSIATAGLRETALCEELSRIRQRLSGFESGTVLIDLGRQLMALKASQASLLAEIGRINTLEEALERVSKAFADSEAARTTAEAELEALSSIVTALGESEAPPCEQGGDACAGCRHALSARCILYVGGRTAMLAQYRQLAERLGVRLIHHDGGQEESLSRLPEMIVGADAVVCPTDQVSHAAYYQVKSQCKRAGKPCLFYQGSSVSRFAAAIGKVSRQEAGSRDQVSSI